MSIPWTGTALDQLAAIYVGLELNEQRELARGVERINATLADDPASLGESRAGDLRIWFPGPLVVTFRLLPGGGAEVVYVSPPRTGRSGG